MVPLPRTTISTSTSLPSSTPGFYDGGMPAGEARSFSTADLARGAGIAEDRIRRFVELGILEPADGAFRPADIQRVRVAEALDRAGDASRSTLLRSSPATATRSVGSTPCSKIRRRCRT